MSDKHTQDHTAAIGILKLHFDRLNANARSFDRAADQHEAQNSRKIAGRLKLSIKVLEAQNGKEHA